MYVFDHRQRYKGAEELERDKHFIMTALTDLYGYDLFIYDLPSRQELRNTKKYPTIKVDIIDEVGFTGITGFTKSFFKSRKPVKELQALAYGEVVYLREKHDEEHSTVCVWLKGSTLLTVDYTGTIDLWKFSLHYQNAIKGHEEAQFLEQLKQDKRFFERI